MKSGQKVLGFLLILAGIISNPWLLSKLFSNDGQITTTAVFASLLLVEVSIVLLGVSVWFLGRKLLMNIGMFVFSSWLTLAISVLADRAYGHFLMPETANLLFPAFSKAKHHTSEFELSVQMNNLGFRGPNTTTEKRGKRVLIIGDSFTFGWGIEEEETWIHLLSEKYPDIEFLNLGQGGNHPGDYVRIAKEAVPVLNPDMVLVGILQGNDIHQLMRVIEFEESGRSAPKPKQTSETQQARLSRYLGLVFPNFTKRFPACVSIQKRWKKDAASLLEELSETQLGKYHSLNSEIRNDFENGLLNPSLIYESMHHPKMFREAVDTSNVLCRKAIIRLHDHLMELKTITENNEAELIVLSLPNRPYGFENDLKPLHELGFSVAGCDTLNADMPTSLGNSETDVLLLDSIKLPSDKAAFNRYDGHWNAEGNRIFAKQLINKLDSLPKWKRFLTL